MVRAREQTGGDTSVRAGIGPYRQYPLADPAVKVRLSEAVFAAQREGRRMARAQRWLTWLAAGGFVAAAMVVSPLGESGDGAPKAVVWVPMAAGATYAIVCAGRAGARVRELEVEVAGIELLSEALERAPSG